MGFGDWLSEAVDTARGLGSDAIDSVQEVKRDNEYKQRLGQAWYNSKNDTPDFYKGNIDINNRKVYAPEGKDYIQTEESFGYDIDKDNVVSLPRIIDGQEYTKEQAIDHFKNTGQHLGVYTREAGESDKAFYDRFDRDGQDLHNRQAEYYKDQMPDTRSEYERFIADDQPLQDASLDMLGVGKGLGKVAETAPILSRGKLVAPVGDIYKGLDNRVAAEARNRANKLDIYNKNKAIQEQNLAKWDRGLGSTDLSIAEGLAKTQLGRRMKPKGTMTNTELEARDFLELLMKPNHPQKR